MSKQSYYVILNANAGTANAAGISADMLRELFEANDLSATIDARSEVDLSTRLGDAVASDAPVPGLLVPLLDLGRPAAIADFILSQAP